jgi:NAD(P)-dependent dehydrogenase (short-subunit alcohol dehydrogenase family)
MAGDLSGKVALITGSTGNLGRAAVEAFRVAGARLALLDRSVERLAKAFPDLEGVAHFAGVDLVQLDAVAAVCLDVQGRFGRIDVLFNAVGAFRGGKPVHEEEPSTWDLLLDVNLRAALATCRAVTPIMVRQGSGRIINTVAGAAFAGQAGQAAYAASKAALLRLSESLARELAADGITVNCIVPGTLDTPQNRAANPGTDPCRWVSPEAVAEVVLFLASDAARAVTGAALTLPERGA